MVDVISWSPRFNMRSRRSRAVLALQAMIFKEVNKDIGIPKDATHSQPLAQSSYVVIRVFVGP